MEIMNDDGTMARLPELREMADAHNIKLISIADLIAYRLKKESIVEKGEEVDMPTLYGHFRLIPFRQKSNGLEHIALIKGDVTTEEPVLVRVHSSCATGDIFGSMRLCCVEGKLLKSLFYPTFSALGKNGILSPGQNCFFTASEASWSASFRLWKW